MNLLTGLLHTQLTDLKREKKQHKDSGAASLRNISIPNTLTSCHNPAYMAQTQTQEAQHEPQIIDGIGNAK